MKRHRTVLQMKDLDLTVTNGQVTFMLLTLK